MVYVKNGLTYIVRLEKGEEIINSLVGLCKAEKIKTGSITGLGAVNDAKIGLLVTSKKEYVSSVLFGDMEITSLVGNITEKDGEPYLHVHASFADKDNNVKGGHLNYAFVSATAELFVTTFDVRTERFFDELTGLNLMRL